MNTFTKSNDGSTGNADETSSLNNSSSAANPFTNLIDSLKDNAPSSTIMLVESPLPTTGQTAATGDDFKINRLFEHIFQFTLDPNYANANNKCVFIGEMDSTGRQNQDVWLNKDNLDEVS